MTISTCKLFCFQLFCVVIIDNRLHPFIYLKTKHIIKDLHCCEVMIKIHVCYTVLHTSEDTVKLLTCFLIQCPHVCVDMWLKCLAAGRMVFIVQRICCKTQTWKSGWLSVQTIFFNPNQAGGGGKSAHRIFKRLFLRNRKSDWPQTRL